MKQVPDIPETEFNGNLNSCFRLSGTSCISSYSRTLFVSLSFTKKENKQLSGRWGDTGKPEQKDILFRFYVLPPTSNSKSFLNPPPQIGWGKGKIGVRWWEEAHGGAPLFLVLDHTYLLLCDLGQETNKTSSWRPTVLSFLKDDFSRTHSACSTQLCCCVSVEVILKERKEEQHVLDS